jgi:hypothetical protein
MKEQIIKYFLGNLLLILIDKSNNIYIIEVNVSNFINHLRTSENIVLPKYCLF